jgi:hypothetical protein
MSLFDRRPALRWAVPATVAGLVAAGVAVAPLGAAANDGLPPRTAQELLVSLQQRDPVPLSGTVVTEADLGLPDLPMTGQRRAEMSDLVSGSNTLRVWTDGADRSRIALLADSAEADLVRNGRDVWAWSSADNAAEHWTLPDPEARPDATDLPFSPSDLPATPEDAARMVLGALDPTTDVSTSGVGTVAGRSVYELVLKPTQADTLVASVSIATDAETGVPLRVRVYSTKLSDPALQVGFRSVDFAQPDPGVFEFTPPAGATVTEHDAGDLAKQSDAGSAAEPGIPEPTVIGSGWSTVLIADPGPAALGALSGGSDDARGSGTDQIAGMLQALPTTSGAWGTGRVLGGTLFSAILTDDGRIAIGAVPPAVLGDALAQR